MVARPKIALMTIVSASSQKEAKQLQNMLESVKGHVDAIYLQLNAPKGKPVNNKVMAVAKRYTQNIQTYEWTGNFANARNALMESIPQEYDWLLWLDTDDTVENPENIRPSLAVMPNEVHGVMILYDYQKDEYGNVVVALWSMRCVRNDGSYAWKSSFDDEETAVHETLVAKRDVKQAGNDEWKVIHNIDENHRVDSLLRNIKLLESMAERQKKQPKGIDPRIMFYLGSHYYEAHNYNKAQEYFIDYLDISGWSEERAEAHIYLGKIFTLHDQEKMARNAFLFALGEHADNAGAYLGLGKLEASNQRWEQAARWFKKGIGLKRKLTSMVRYNYDWELYTAYAEALSKLGGKNLPEALKMAQKAFKLRPYDPISKDNRDNIEKLLDYRDDMRAVIRLLRKLKKEKEDNKALQLLGSLPETYNDSPVVVAARQEYQAPVKWPKKSMAIYCGPGAIGTWGPWSLEEGIGGSEEAVIQLSRELAQLGWKVTVYATPGTKTGLDNGANGELIVAPEWKQYWEFNIKDEFDVLVSWRNPSFFQNKFKARKKYIWLHDVIPKEEFIPEVIDQVDKVIVLSQYHRSLYPMVPDDKIFLSANGIVPEDFEGIKEERDPHRIIWMSSHVRGLELLYTIWPDIKAAVPQAKLDIYYGWDSFISIVKDNPERMMWRRKMVDWEKQLDDVVDHGKISHKQIIEEINKSGIWAYPCVTGDTLIDMPRNYQEYPMGVPIRKLVGKKNFPVWSFNENTGRFELKNVTWVAKTREKAKIIKINWTDGTSLRCTPDHKIYTYKRGWVEAQDLETGESAVAFKKHSMVQVSVGEGKWPYEHRVIAEYMQGKIPKGYHVDHKDGNCFNNEPDNLQILSAAEHMSKTHKEQYRVRPKIEAQKLALSIYRKTDKGKRQLADIGRRRSKMFWDNLTPEAREEFVKSRGAKVAEANKKRIQAMTPKERSLIGAEGRQSRWNHKVESIEDAGYEDVYDMNVEDNHSFIAGGVVVHNCPFPEIFCITALKAQAGGAVPVSSNFAALDETVQFGVKVPMEAKDESVSVGKWDKKELEEYKKELIEMLLHPESQERIRPKMIKWAKTQSWQNVAKGWSEAMQ